MLNTGHLFDFIQPATANLIAFDMDTPPNEDLSQAVNFLTKTFGVSLLYEPSVTTPKNQKAHVWFQTNPEVSSRGI